MRYTCAISGAQVSTGDSISLNPRKLGAPIHPIFYAPQEALQSLGLRIAKDDFPSSELHLVVLALLNSTSLVEFRGAVEFNEPLVRQWAARTFKVCTALHCIPKSALEHFPRVAFSSIEGATEGTLPHILDVFDAALESHKNGHRGEARADDMSRRQDALERLVRNPHKDPSTYAPRLAAWAAVAGSFPTFEITDPSCNRRPLSDYWQQIIADCARSKKVLSIKQSDLKELEDHCLEHIPQGSLFSFRLFQILSNASTKLNTHWDFGDIDDIPPAPLKAFKIMDSLGAAQEGKQYIQEQISIHEPKRVDYPDMISFVLAKLKWKQSNNFT